MIDLFKEQGEALLPSSELYEGSHRPKTKRSLCTPKLLTLWTIINLVSSLALISTFALQQPPTINSLLKKTSYYSPVLESIEIPTFTSQINGSITTTTPTNLNPPLGRLPPGPAADHAWHRFEEIRTVAVSKQDIINLGKDPLTAARFPDPHWHFGEDAYMAQLDVVHQIHCLNQLRKRAFGGYHRDGGEEEKEVEEWVWVHLQHCVSILLENLMCGASTDMITLNWIEEAEYPFPDFGVNKQCRDFEAVMEWQDARAVDTDTLLNMSKPTEGIEVIKGERGWWELVGHSDSVSTGDMHSHGI